MDEGVCAKQMIIKKQADIETPIADAQVLYVNDRQDKSRGPMQVRKEDVLTGVA